MTHPPSGAPEVQFPPESERWFRWILIGSLIFTLVSIYGVRKFSIHRGWIKGQGPKMAEPRWADLKGKIGPDALKRLLKVTQTPLKRAEGGIELLRDAAGDFYLVCATNLPPQTKVVVYVGTGGSGKTYTNREGLVFENYLFYSKVSADKLAVVGPLPPLMLKVKEFKVSITENIIQSQSSSVQKAMARLKSTGHFEKYPKKEFRLFLEKPVKLPEH